jgi:Copper transport outer membrane protein, MctB
MINFRFHIVSLTAVLLALGIGLVLGTTFLDDALEEALKSQLDDLETSLDAARVRNDELSAEVETEKDVARAFDEQIGERLYAGQLQGDPVLIVATRGVDGQWVDDVMRSLGQANAQVLGTWWLTDRLALDDDSELTDLASALELTTDDPSRLRQSLAQDVADVLFGATDQPATADDPSVSAPAEPPLAARLRDSGFLEYQMPDGVDGDVVRLPSSGVRVVVVDGPGAALPASDLVQPVLAALATDAPVPVVAVQPSTSGDPATDEAWAPLVAAVRDDDTLSDRVSTVDDLEQVAGGVATILALADARPGEPKVGHYGIGDGASRLLPPTEEDA